MIEDFKMWSYWRDKYGTLEAVRKYYAEEINKDPTLQFAVLQMAQAEESINRIMTAKADAHQDEYE